MTRPSINLPPIEKVDSAAGTKLFFDTYGVRPLEISANDINSTVGFFTSKGFEDDAAIVTATIIIRQAKIDGVPVFTIIDSLKDLNGLQLSAVVAQILNKYRPTTSSLGFKSTTVVKENINRNIRP